MLFCWCDVVPITDRTPTNNSVTSCLGDHGNSIVRWFSLLNKKEKNTLGRMVQRRCCCLLRKVSLVWQGKQMECKLRIFFSFVLCQARRKFETEARETGLGYGTKDASPYFERALLYLPRLANCLNSSLNLSQKSDQRSGITAHEGHSTSDRSNPRIFSSESSCNSDESIVSSVG